MEAAASNSITKLFLNKKEGGLPARQVFCVLGDLIISIALTLFTIKFSICFLLNIPGLKNLKLLFSLGKDKKLWTEYTCLSGVL